MTEKRYNRLVSSIDYYYCTDNQNENQGLTEKDMLNRLNEQDDLINALREELELADKQNTSLEKENEQLKKDRNEMFIRERDTENELRDAQYELRDVKKENEQLKNFIKKLTDNTGQIKLMNGYGYHISEVIKNE